MLHRRSSLALLPLTLLTIIGCGGPAVQNSQPNVSAQPRTVGTEAAPVVGPASGRHLLPAGIYWEGYRTCRACPQKVWLVAAAVDSAEAARTARAEAAKLGLPAGYPVIEHGAQIQLESTLQSKILVIYGVTSTPAWAAEFRAELRGHGLTTQIIEAPQEDAGHGSDIVVSLMPGSGKVAAYSKADIGHIEKDGGFELYFTDDVAAARRKLQSFTPVCQLERDQVFAPDRRDFEWYRWVPVSCNGQLAFVDWRETRTMATFFSDAKGHRLRQVVIVECDVPTIYEWDTDAKGVRLGKPREVLSSEGC